MGPRLALLLLSSCATFATGDKQEWTASELKEPTPIACDDFIVDTPTVPEEPPPAVMMTTGLRWPVFPRQVTSYYGIRQDPIAKSSMRFHRGIDVSAAYGATVYASLRGRVVSEGMAGGHGHRVTVDHGNGVVTSYSHLALALVGQRMWVEEGQAVGVVGDTGRSTGPHLHFEVTIDGQSVDPFPLLGGRLPELHEFSQSFAPPKLPIFSAVHAVAR